VLASKLDRGVFPGEQGGPHVNAIAALAVALKLAKTDQFRALQQQTVNNAQRLAAKLQEHGLKIAYGGTNTHLLNVDCGGSVIGPDGTGLSGDMAARLLDLIGIVANRQTIPGDTSPLRPTGLRLGTPWITQRGFGPAEIDELGDIIADLLLSAVPFSYAGRRRPLARAKVPFDVFQDTRTRVRDLAMRVGIDTQAVADDYPHFYYLDSVSETDAWQTLQIRGENAAHFLDVVLTGNVNGLQDGATQPTYVLNPDGTEMSQGVVHRVDEMTYLLHVEHHASTITAWLRSLSDGFVIFSEQDVYAKLPGPVEVQALGTGELYSFDAEACYAANKAFFIGRDGNQYAGPKGEALPRFTWEDPAEDTLKTTSLHALHQKMGAKMVPFAGYDMPVWYTSVSDEHMAVRNSSGIFDVTHMGVFDFHGPGAAKFLDAVTTNDVLGLAVGHSHYTYFLDVDGIPHDDLMIYRLADDHYLVVVNASNNDKNWAWLKAIKDQAVMIDPDDPTRVIGTDDFTMRDLRDPSAQDDMRVDIALQGPASTEILLKLAGLDADKAAVAGLPWAGITHVTLGGYDLIISRTGYTGERVAYELFVHPDKAAALFHELVELGATPCGLAARDSLRIEAGLPLYGHELAGPLGMGPADAGFGNYVKLWKPFFVGKKAHIQREMQRESIVVRFRLNNRGVRPPHQGDPLVDTKGRTVGIVTSCSIDSEGYQLGQAYVKADYAKRDTQLAVFSGSARMKANPNETAFGKKYTLPDVVTVLSRFPARRKK